MTDDPLLDLFRRALHEVDPSRGSDWAGITLDLPIEDLGLDSVKLMEMIAYVEDETGVTFEDDQLAGVERLDELAALVRQG